jgi:hypothetical protein
MLLEHEKALVELRSKLKAHEEQEEQRNIGSSPKSVHGN